MTKKAQSTLLTVIFALSTFSLAPAHAQTLSGTITNGTTNKPAAGDEVILINLTTKMEIAANTKADSNGKFSFPLAGAPGPHLIRAVHQGVTYHQVAPPGVATVDVTVYDVTTKVSELSLTADVMRFQADAGTLQGVRLIVVNNTSSPPKTQMNDHNLEFYLPAGAKVEQVQARAPNGQPIGAEAVPQAEKNRYAVNFPLRPGETQFQLEFTLPYTGEIKIDPKLLYPAEHFVVVVPKSMQFKANDSKTFEAVKDPTKGDNTMEVAKDTKPGQLLAFTLKGSGMIAESPAEAAAGAPSQEAEAQGQAQQAQSQAPSQSPRPDNRPGGGLGVPIDAPDALQQYRWPILGGFAILLAIGGWMVTKRQPVIPSGAATTAKTAPTSVDLNAASHLTTSAATPLVAPAVTRSSILLEALKEELFQLEVERKQGKITLEEYEKARAALDLTLERALNRQT